MDQRQSSNLCLRIFCAEQQCSSFYEQILPTYISGWYIPKSAWLCICHSSTSQSHCQNTQKIFSCHHIFWSVHLFHHNRFLFLWTWY